MPCVAELRWTHNQPVWAMRARRVCSVRFLRSINRLCATPLASFCNSPRCLSLSLHNLVVRQRTTHTHTHGPKQEYDRRMQNSIGFQLGVRAVITGVLRGCFLEIGVCFLHNATQREIKEATKSHRRKNHGRSFLCLSRLLDVTRRKIRTLEKTGGPCFFDNNRPYVDRKK